MGFIGGHRITCGRLLTRQDEATGALPAGWTRRDAMNWRPRPCGSSKARTGRSEGVRHRGGNRALVAILARPGLAHH
jgi:hypothetical protein